MENLQSRQMEKKEVVYTVEECVNGIVVQTEEQGYDTIKEVCTNHGTTTYWGAKILEDMQKTFNRAMTDKVRITVVFEGI